MRTCRFALIAAAALMALVPLAQAAEPVADRKATLTWTAPATDVEGTPIVASTLRYHVYRSTGPSELAGKTRIASNLSTLTLVDGARPAGVTECYQVTALFADAPETESAPSSEGCKSHPKVRAGGPGLTVQ